jgi:hypothetical protein
MHRSSRIYKIYFIVMSKGYSVPGMEIQTWHLATWVD